MEAERQSVFSADLPFNSRASFCGVPAVDTAALEAGCVAILGAPVDWGTSFRPGARSGPAAVRDGDYLESDGRRPALPSGRDCLTELRVRDVGDASVVRGYLEPSLEAVESAVAHIVSNGCIPVVIGGEHTITLANVTGVARHRGPRSFAMVHFDAHADLGQYPRPQTFGHGMPMRHLIDAEVLAPGDLHQFGLRGYWPGPEGLDWIRKHGVDAHFMVDLPGDHFSRALSNTISAIKAMHGGRVFVSLDIDALDPSFAPATGTPEPGGFTSREMLWALRQIGEELDVIGADFVEVAPVYDQPSNVTAVLANRLILALLTGMAAKKAERQRL